MGRPSRFFVDYQGDIIRPPSEAFSLILQVTTGCSHNRCTFCGAYRDKPFRVKSWDRIEADLEFAATWCGRHTTLFLADGDALALSHETLTALLRRIREKLPWIRRISSYATAQNIAAIDDGHLRVYRDLGLSRLYMGLESGHDPTLVSVAKGVDSEAMIVAGQRVRAAKMFCSVTCLLGIAGAEGSREHARATAAALNRMQPNQIAILTLMVLPNTPLHRRMRAGRFVMPEPMDLCRELRSLVAHLEPFRTQLHVNHASNHLALSGRLPRDRDRILAAIDLAMAGTVALRPEFLRAL